MARIRKELTKTLVYSTNPSKLRAIKEGTIEKDSLMSQPRGTDLENAQ